MHVVALVHADEDRGQALEGAGARERPRVDEKFRMILDPSVTASGCHVYVQNAELHTHGVGAPDLGLAAWRSATILNTLTGKEPYPLPRRTAFTTFGLEPGTHIPPARRPDPAVPLTPLADVR